MIRRKSLSYGIAHPLSGIAKGTMVYEVNFPVDGGFAGDWTEKGGKYVRNELTELDRFDRAILHVLAADGRISITELAQRIGLSKSPTQARLRRLETDGIITGYRALFDPIRMGLDHVSFVEVRLTDTRETALASAP